MCKFVETHNCRTPMWSWLDSITAQCSVWKNTHAAPDGSQGPSNEANLLLQMKWRALVSALCHSHQSPPEGFSNWGQVPVETLGCSLCQNWLLMILPVPVQIADTQNTQRYIWQQLKEPNSDGLQKSCETKRHIILMSPKWGSSMFLPNCSWIFGVWEVTQIFLIQDEVFRVWNNWGVWKRSLAKSVSRQMNLLLIWRRKAIVSVLWEDARTWITMCFGTHEFARCSLWLTSCLVGYSCFC